MISQRTKLHILDIIRDARGSAFKKSVQNKTGYAWGTICSAIDDLLADGLLLSQRVPSGNPGRPVTSLIINPNSYQMAGVDLGGAYWRITFCDLNFEHNFTTKIPLPRLKSPDDLGEAVMDFIGKSCAEYKIKANELRQIGIAISGRVEPETGVVFSAGNLGIPMEANYPLSDVVSKRFRCPCLVIPSQSAMAWAEHLFSEHRGIDNLIVVNIGVGLGSAIIANGELIKSRPDRPAGYIGHFYIPGNRRPCGCGQTGCVESYAGGNALVKVAKEFHLDVPDAQTLDAMAQNGHHIAQMILKRASLYNAFGISTLIQTYHPDAVVFVGGQCREEGFLYRQTIERLKRLLPPDGRNDSQFSISKLGEYGTALGAARMAVETYF